jgi:CubicO group peptidase (beta-lactamase class C family)
MSVRASLAFLAAAAAVALVGADPPARAQTSFDRVAAVSERVKGALQKYDVPGASVAVFRNYRIEWARGYGMANVDTRSPVEPLTVFQAASISKPLAALAAMRLVQAGRLDLDKDVNAYLTSWKVPASDLTRATPVTLRRILSHTAGLGVHGFKGYEAGAPLPTVIQVLDGLPPANSEAVRVALAPSTKFDYSGGGYTILQQLLEDVTHTPFPELMRQQVLDPLGLGFSTYEQPLPAAFVPFASAGHEKGKVIAGERHVYPEMAAAGLTTTASDLARFAIAMQHARDGAAGAILSRENALLMTTPVPLPEAFGLGFENFPPKEKEQKYFGHTGGNAGYRTWLLATKEGGNGVVILTNGDEWKAVKEIGDAVREVYGF